MAIYDNSPDADIGFKATLSFVLAIVAFGFGTLAALALETPIGILFALTAGLLLALLPFMAGWVNPIGKEVHEAMESAENEEAPQAPVPRPGGQPARNPPAERHP